MLGEANTQLGVNLNTNLNQSSYRYMENWCHEPEDAFTSKNNQKNTLQCPKVMKGLFCSNKSFLHTRYYLKKVERVSEIKRNLEILPKIYLQNFKKT